MDENPADNGTDRTTAPAGEAATAATPGAAATQTFEPPQAPPSGHAHHEQPPPRGGVFDMLRGLDVRRTPDRWIGGVAAGLAHRVGLDPLVIRAGFIVLGLFFGLGLALYLLAWALIPDATETTHLERGLSQGRFASIGIVILAAVVLLGIVLGWNGGSLGSALFGLIVLAGIGYGMYHLWGNRPFPGAVGDHGYHAAYGQPSNTGGPPAGGGATARGADTGYAPPPPPGTTTGSPVGPPPPGDRGTYVSTPPQPPVPPAPHRARRLSGGGAIAALTAGALLVIVGGLVWSADAIDMAGNPITVAWCAGLVMLGVVLLGLGLAGRRAGFVGFFAAIAAFAVLVTAPLPAGLRWNGDSGQVNWTPTAAHQETSYEWGAGEATLDLRELDADDITADELDVGLGIGELRIYVPEDVNVVVHSDIGAGVVTLSEDNRAIDGEITDAVSSRVDPNFGPPSNDRTPSESEWGRDEGGVNLRKSTVVGERPADLEINAEVGLGEITIIGMEGQ